MEVRNRDNQKLGEIKDLVMESPGRVNYAVLAVPFFFSGLIIILILDSFPANSGKRYGFDLAGAAVGCLRTYMLS